MERACIRSRPVPPILGKRNESPLSKGRRDKRRQRSECTRTYALGSLGRRSSAGVICVACAVLGARHGVGCMPWGRLVAGVICAAGAVQPTTNCPLLCLVIEGVNMWGYPAL